MFSFSFFFFFKLLPPLRMVSSQSLYNQTIRCGVRYLVAHYTHDTRLDIVRESIWIFESKIWSQMQKKKKSFRYFPRQRELDSTFRRTKLRKKTYLCHSYSLLLNKYHLVNDYSYACRYTELRTMYDSMEIYFFYVCYWHILNKVC